MVLLVGVMIRVCPALALITASLMNSIELLAPICPAPWIVLSRLVSVSTPLFTLPKMRLALLETSLRVIVPPPLSVVPSAIRRSALLPALASWIVPVLAIVPIRTVLELSKPMKVVPALMVTASSVPFCPLPVSKMPAPASVAKSIAPPVRSTMPAKLTVKVPLPLNVPPSNSDPLTLELPVTDRVVPPVFWRMLLAVIVRLLIVAL